MNNFQQEIYKTIDILTEQKLSQLGFDKTRRGKVVSVNDTTCIVEVDGEIYSCKIRRGIYIEPNDIVFVKFPKNSNVDKYVDTILGSNEMPENLIISAQEILDKLKTVDGEGSGLDADLLDGKHGSEFATKKDLEDIGVDISGEAIVDNINASQSIIDDKNLSINVNDAIDKKHSHTNKTIIDGVAQSDIDAWNTVNDKSDIGHKHTELDITDLDKYTKVETDVKINAKADKNYVDEELVKKSDTTHNHDLDYEPKNSNIQSHITSKTNPHNVTKSQVGLSNVENKSSATIRNEITKANVESGLGYTPEDNSKKGVAHGYAPLDSNVKIPLSVLPDVAKQQTYVVEALGDRDDLTGLIMGEKCYITSTSDSYIWDGDSWEILAKADWENVNLQWTNIVGKPSSNVSDIDDATSKRHIHGNKGIIDTITQTLIDRWNSAWAHISDTIKHITSTERSKWNTVDNKADTTYVNTEMDKKSDKLHLHTELDITDLDKYTKAETDVKLATKVDNARVLTDVPTNAKFTDTIYTLPNASTQTLGGVKIGANLSIADDGTLSALSGDERSSFIIKQEVFIATAGQTLFNLTKGHYQPNTNTISVYLYGEKQPNVVLNEISTSSFEITEPLKMGDVVIVEYFELSSATPYPIHGSDHLTGGYDPISKATSASDGLMAKEDKSKLNEIETGANKYIHPATHSLDMITETTSKKILTATERIKISEVDNKVDKATGKGLSDENYTLPEKNKLAGIEVNANKYTHPSNHPANMITESSTKRFVSDTEKADWNAKETTTGAQSKVDIHANLINNPHGVTKTQIGLGSVQDYGLSTQLEAETGASNAKYMTPLRTKQAIDKQVADKKYVTQSELGDAGFGDMIKAVYDKNNDGIVDNAEKVSGFTVETNVPANAKFTDTVYTHPSTHPASMITGLPTSLPANGGTSDMAKGLIGDDTRTINSPPSEYMNSGARYLGRAGWQTEFKNIATMGVGAHFSGTYCYVETKNPWSDPSGGYPIQIAYGNGNPCWRVGISLTAWGEWKSFSESLHVGKSAPNNKGIGWIDTSL